MADVTLAPPRRRTVVVVGRGGVVGTDPGTSTTSGGHGTVARLLPPERAGELGLAVSTSGVLSFADGAGPGPARSAAPVRWVAEHAAIIATAENPAGALPEDVLEGRASLLTWPQGFGAFVSPARGPALVLASGTDEVCVTTEGARGRLRRPELLVLETATWTLALQGVGRWVQGGRTLRPNAEGALLTALRRTTPAG